jgi:hypothetical protein
MAIRKNRSIADKRLAEVDEARLITDIDVAWGSETHAPVRMWHALNYSETRIHLGARDANQLCC